MAKAVINIQGQALLLVNKEQKRLKKKLGSIIGKDRLINKLLSDVWKEQEIKQNTLYDRLYNDIVSAKGNKEQIVKLLKQFLEDYGK